jgi:mRNA interferase RelE/StbE
VAFEVRLKPLARRAFPKLPREVQRRLASRLDALSVDPRPPGSEKLAGEERFYRVRVGDFRVVYQINDRARLVLIAAIGHRSDVYRRL